MRKIKRRDKKSIHLPTALLQVYCNKCSNWMYAVDVGFINYSIGHQGEKILKFKCLCGEERSSTVFMRGSEPTRRREDDKKNEGE